MLNKRNIFLLDGIGALNSALLTGIVLPLFSDPLGLPPQLLRGLAAFPVAYLTYSFTCYFFAPVIRKWMLAGIIFGNSLYCLVSLSLLLWLQGIKPWGIGLLITEISVILVVIAIEVRIYRTAFKSPP